VLERTFVADVPKGQLTAWLRAWKDDGDVASRDQLFVAIEGDLQAIARRTINRMAHVRHKIQPTELVDELYIKLAEYDVAWENRHYFFAMVSRIMRNVLIDLARSGQAAKRPPSFMRLEAADVGESVSSGSSEFEVFAFYHELDHLREMNARHADSFEMHCVLGLTLEEVAASLNTSPATAKRDVRAARAWLVTRLHDSSASQ